MLYHSRPLLAVAAPTAGAPAALLAPWGRRQQYRWLHDPAPRRRRGPRGNAARARMFATFPGTRSLAALMTTGTPELAADSGAEVVDAWPDGGGLGGEGAVNSSASSC